MADFIYLLDVSCESTGINNYFDGDDFIEHFHFRAVFSFAEFVISLCLFASIMCSCQVIKPPIEWSFFLSGRLVLTIGIRA